MAKVVIAAVPAGDPAAVKVENELQQARAAVAEFASQLASNGGSGRSDLDNWLQAEQQMYWVPSCELEEQNGQYRLRVALPGLETKQIMLTAMPQSIVVTSPGKGNQASQVGEIHFSEFNRNALLRCIDFPEKIDTKAVKANLERGILEIVAPKSAGGSKPAAATAKRVPAKPKQAAAKTPRVSRANGVRRQKAE